MAAVYDEIVEFLARGTSPDGLAAFQPSDDARERVEDLLERRNSSGLGEEDEFELEHYLLLEHLMRLAKARARRYLAHE